MITKFLTLAFCIFFFSIIYKASAQDKRAQYPPILTNSNFGVSIGYINYPFSRLQLEPGFQAEAITIPHVGVRIILFGHEFNKYLSAQISYMRPVKWVLYMNINGNQTNHSVWMNVAGLTVKSNIPISKKFSGYAEGGLGIITRNGITIGQTAVVKNANYATVLTGAGLQYRINNRWHLLAGATYSPRNSKVRQPYTIFYSGGFTYNMRQLSAEKIQRNATSGYIFPKNLIQASYSTNTFGYDVNEFVANGKIPVFWGGTVAVKKGATIQYQRNVFHARKVFSLDWGISASYWQTQKNKDNFFTLSVFPVLRFTLLHTKPADMYFYYSVAGPAFLSKPYLDEVTTGKKFTFQDLMGIGAFITKDRRLNAEIRIGHYSNGNIFPTNNGVMIPLTFGLGHTF